MEELDEEDLEEVTLPLIVTEAQFDLIHFSQLLSHNVLDFKWIQVVRLHTSIQLLHLVLRHLR